MKPTSLTTVAVVIMMVASALMVVGGVSAAFTYTQNQAAAQMSNNNMVADIIGVDTKNQTTGISVSIVKNAEDMGDKAFQPNPINIKVGDTVTWLNDDSDKHTVTSGFGPNDPNKGKQFDSGLLAEGQTFIHTFKTAGEFNYFCEPHPSMIGKVIVT